MFGRLTTARLFALSLGAGLIPCLALAVDMPTDIAPERVDTANLGVALEGSTARAPADWTVQVGAYTDRAKAEARLDRVAQIRPDELGQAVRLVTPLQWDDTHTVYRARFAGLGEQVALGLCAALKGLGESCFAAADEKVSAANNNIEPAIVQSQQVNPANPDMVLAEALATVVAQTPALQEIAEQPDPPFATADTGVAPPRRGDGLSGPPTVTGAVIAMAAVKVPALRADLAGTVPARTILVAENQKMANPVSNDELSTMRGGFFTAAGAQFDFGASIQTMVNGQLALMTNLTWTPAGPSIQQLSGLGQAIQSQVQSSLANAGIGTGGSPAVPAASLSNAANTAGGNAPTSNSPVTGTPIPTGPVTNLANNTATGALNTATGALNTASNAINNVSSQVGPTPTVPGPAAPNTPPSSPAPQTTITIPSVLSGVNIPSAGGGSTQVLANISPTQIQNIILNSASNQTISQNTNVTLTIYNFQQWQQQLAQHALSAQLANEMLAIFGH